MIFYFYKFLNLFCYLLLKIYETGYRKIEINTGCSVRQVESGLMHIGAKSIFNKYGCLTAIESFVKSIWVSHEACVVDDASSP